MAKIAVGVVLRERLGESGARELKEFVGQHADEVRSEVMTMCDASVSGLSTEITDRFAEVKIELSEKIGDLKTDLAERLAHMRVELLRWTFVFWIGQFTAMLAAMLAALAMFAQWFRP